MSHNEFWKRKLLAFLHDPPSKPYSIRDHWEIAQSLVAQAGLSEELSQGRMSRAADRMAACADRIAFPKPSVLSVDWSNTQVFRHPLGGSQFMIAQPIKSEAEAEDLVSQAQLRLGLDDDYQRNFYLHWSLWPRLCAEEKPHLALLPADTRIPDHTVWTHCSLVSALQSCCMDETGLQDTDFQPAFLIFQIGPVQEFISQARTTRDCWSGSYLLSWLMASGLKALSDKIGPDCVLFPSLQGQPLFDFLNRELLGDATWQEMRPADEQILTPGLPNRFLAIVPGSRARELANLVREAMLKELTEQIGPACLQWLGKTGHPLEDQAVNRWRQQIRQFLQFYWQVRTWGDVQESLEQFGRIPAGFHGEEGTISPAQALNEAREAARRIPEGDRDPRNYRHRSIKDENGRWRGELEPDEQGQPVIDNPAFAWPAHYALGEFLLAARRNTRDFEPWAADQEGKQDQTLRGAVKDMFSGKEETIGTEDWQKGLSQLKHPNGTPMHLFREAERLGAMSIIKRVWHIAYLEKKRDLKRKRISFDSVTAVAAGAWVNRMKGLCKDKEIHEKLEAFLLEASKALPDENCDRLETIDAALFHDVEWDRLAGESKESQARAIKAAQRALKRLQSKEEGQNVGKPMRYVAIIALDGDDMGKWVSGAKTPSFECQLDPKASQYFKDAGLESFLKQPRHVSPSYHLQFSQALGNFAIYLAGPIVTHYGGQLIYAGGDDVLAMLPAETAVPCARALRMAFRGDPALHDPHFPGVLQREKDQEVALQFGFVALDGDWKGWSNFKSSRLPRGYPLIVPGCGADVSAGIAIGHMHTPLQILIAAARDAEKRAKQRYGKAAFAVNLAKRSGELVRWGAKWDDGAVGLSEDIYHGLVEGFLSEKFPYAMLEALQPYVLEPSLELESNGRRPSRDGWPVSPEVIGKELAHALSRHAKNGSDWSKEIEGLQTSSEGYLQKCFENKRSIDDFLGPFVTASFIRKGGE